MEDIMYKGFNLVELAGQALTRPDDFGWWGKEEMFNTWGWSGIDVNNSSNVLDECNFRVICDDLLSKYPDDFEIVGLKHWAVGHVDRLTVRILDKPGDVTEDNITPAFREAIEWLISLDEYPIADEMKFDEACYEYVFNYLVQDIPSDVYIKNSKEETAALILEELNSSYDDLDYTELAMGGSSISDNAIRYAAYDLGLCSIEYRDVWDEWIDEEGLPPIKWGDDWGINSNKIHELNGQLELDFGD